MESEGDWVQVRFPTEIDMWSPSSVEMENPVPLKVQFSGPARLWTDALPIGNGRLGAMVWGGVASETLQLNDDTLWTGIPGNYTNPDAPKVLSRVRELVDNAQYVEATAASVKLLGDPTEVYQPLGDIKLEFDDSHSAYAEETYQRELDLDTAMVKMKYTVGDVEFTREHFASNPHQVIAMKLSASKSGALSFTVSLESKLHHHLHINSENQVILEGSCPGKRAPPKVNVNNNPKGIQCSAVLDLHISDGAGMIEVLDGKKLKVQNSNWAIIFLVASSSFDDSFTKPSDSERDPTSESLDKLRSIRHISYSDIYGHHLDDYQKLFRRVSLQLSKSARGNLFKGMEKFEPSRTESYTEGVIAGIISTAERVKSFKTDEDPSLVELLFQYGRYLLISCSRPGTQVANLQGIWNKDVEPKWDASPHLNINLQMNYWPSLPCNLQECQQPLFDYISSLSVNGTKTAHVNYEASGWVVHHVSDIWAKTSPGSRDPKWALWPMGGAWLCTHLWEHYTFTMDEGFLKNKAYPLLEGCASFLLDWLIEGHGGYLETNPSTSPEHNFIATDGKLASVSYSSTMDMAIIREIFSTVISAAETLGRSNDILVEKVRKAQTRLRPTKIAGDGSIMEWVQAFEDPDVHHRHLSHLFGLFPGHTITAEKTPDLYKAAANTLYKRGEEGPGWSTTWKIALWARLHDSEHAYNMVKHLINLVDPDKKIGFEGGLYSNLFTAHPPFQIDANFGFTAAVAEMLVQSTVKDLYLLPALPREKWPSGCVKGLKARGGVTVSICWTEGDLQEVGIWLKNQNSVRLHYNGIIVTAKLSSDTVYTFNRQLKCLKTHTLSEACFL